MNPWDFQNLNDQDQTPNDFREHSTHQNNITNLIKGIGNESKEDLKALVHAVRNSGNIQIDRPEFSEEDIEKNCPFLGRCIPKVLRKTMNSNTCLSKMGNRLPMHHHLKARFPQLNCRSFQETYSTETMFAPLRYLEGYTSAQVFSGRK